MAPKRQVEDEIIKREVKYYNPEKSFGEDFKKYSTEQLKKQIELIENIKKAGAATNALRNQYKQSLDFEKKIDIEREKERLSTESNFKAYLRTNEKLNAVFNVFSLNMKDFQKSLKTTFSGSNLGINLLKGISGAGLFGNFGPQISAGLKGFKDFAKQREENKNDVELLKRITELNRNTRNPLKKEDIAEILKQEGASSYKIFQLLERYEEQRKKEFEEKVTARAEKGTPLGEDFFESFIEAEEKRKKTKSPQQIETKPQRVEFKEVYKPIGEESDLTEYVEETNTELKRHTIYLENISNYVDKSNELLDKKIRQDEENFEDQMEFENRKQDKDDKKDSGGFLSSLFGNLFGGLAKDLIPKLLSGVVSAAGPLLVVAIGAVLTKLAFDWSSNVAKKWEEAQEKEGEKKYEGSALNEAQLKVAKKEGLGITEKTTVKEYEEMLIEKHKGKGIEAAPTRQITTQIDEAQEKIQKKQIAEKKESNKEVVKEISELRKDIVKNKPVINIPPADTKSALLGIKGDGDSMYDIAKGRY
jgi:hypothetical protein